MNKEEVINKLQLLAVKNKDKKYLTLKDIRTVPKLAFYIQLHFRRLGLALEAAHLPSSKLASSMKVKNEDLLKYLSELKAKLGRNPTTWDIYDDNEIFRKYSVNKFSWSLFKRRFNGLRGALEQMELNGKNLSERTENKNNVKKTEEKEYFLNKNRYYGEAAELHVTAELLYRGFQAANIPVDEGLDVLAVKSNKTFYFQVKHKDLDNNEHIKITKSSFEKSGGGNVYYIFVLLTEKIRNFLIIPYHIINDWIREGFVEEKENGYSFQIKKDGEQYKLKDLSLNRYLGRWEDIR